MKQFTANRLASGNRIFPAEIHIDNFGVNIKIPDTFYTDILAIRRYFLAFIFSIASLSAVCQTNKTFKGKLGNIGDDYLEVAINDADASYEYYLDSNEKIVFNGDFKASAVAEMVDGADRAGYTSNVSTKFLYKVSGKYDHGKKVGLWKSEKIIFGTKISGASYNAYQNNWNTLNIDNSGDIESIKTITINYTNNIPDGNATETLNEKGKIVQSINCSIKSNHFVGKFISKNDSKSHAFLSDNNIECYFDDNGFFNGDCIQENTKTNHVVKFSFCHGILLNAVEHNQATGEKTGECINPMCKFLDAKPKLPSYIKIDTIEIGKNTYTGGLSMGISMRNPEGILYCGQFPEKDKNNICYAVNSNCVANIPAIGELSIGFVNKVNFKKYRDIFFVCDSIYADKQFKGDNHPTFIDKINMYRTDYYKIMFTDTLVSEMPYFVGDLGKTIYDKCGHGNFSFPFSFFRIFINNDGSISDVVLKRIKTDVLLNNNDGKTVAFNQDRYNLKQAIPLEDSFIIKNVIDMPKWIPGKDKTGKPIPAFVDVFLWYTTKGDKLDVWVKNEKGYYVKKS